MAKGQLAVTPAIARVTAGDDWLIGFTLWDNGAVAVLTGATIAAAVRDRSGNAVIAAVTQSSATTGATWAGGVVIIAIPSASTDVLTGTEYFLEIQATMSGAKTTWPLIALAVTQDVIA